MALESVSHFFDKYRQREKVGEQTLQSVKQSIPGSFTKSSLGNTIILDKVMKMLPVNEPVPSFAYLFAKWIVCRSLFSKLVFSWFVMKPVLVRTHCVTGSFLYFISLCLHYVTNFSFFHVNLVINTFPLLA